MPYAWPQKFQVQVLQIFRSKSDTPVKYEGNQDCECLFRLMTGESKVSEGWNVNTLFTHHIYPSICEINR